MVMFAQVYLEPGGGSPGWSSAWPPASWPVGSCGAGWYGLFGDILVGLLGAMIGGFVFGKLVTAPTGSWVASRWRSWEPVC